MPVGIDIGTHSIKIAETVRKGNTYVLTRAAQFWLESEDGQIASSKIAKILRDLSATLGLPGEKAIVGLTGRDLNLRYFHFPHVSSQNIRSLIEYEVENLIDKGAKGHLVFDFRILNLPRESASNICALVALAKDELLEEKISTLAPSRVSVSSICPNSIALLHSFVTSQQFSPEETTMLLDLGSENMDIVIQRDGSLIFARNASFGGKNFTEALSKSFNIPFSTAEKIKRVHGEVVRSQSKKKIHPITAVLSATAAQFSSLIQSTISFSRTQTNLPSLKVDRILLSGGGSRLKGLPEYLEPSLGIPVSLFNPLSGIQLSMLPPEKREIVMANAPHYAIALGLTKLASRKNPFALSLLPKRVVKRKEFMATKPFMLAAATVLLTVIATTWAALGHQHSQLLQLENKLKSTITRLNDEEHQFRTILEENVSLARKAQELHAELSRTTFFVEALAALYNTIPPQIWLNRIEMPNMTLSQTHSKDPRLFDADTILVEGFVEESANPGQTLQAFLIALEQYPASQHHMTAKVENAIETKTGHLKFLLSLRRETK